MVGTWVSDLNSTSTFTISSSGTLTGSSSSGSIPTYTIQNWDANKDTATRQYALVVPGSGSTRYTFTFNSATSCQFSVSDQTGYEPFTKQ